MTQGDTRFNCTLVVETILGEMANARSWDVVSLAHRAIVNARRLSEEIEAEWDTPLAQGGLLTGPGWLVAPPSSMSPDYAGPAPEHAFYYAQQAANIMARNNGGA
jgi:hypothetical protein